MIHPSAIVDPSAEVGPGVTIGPWSVIGAEVTIGGDTWIGPHVVINGPTRIGRRNRIHQFNSLGDAPQDKKYRGELSRLEIGDDNVIREYCTFNRGTEGGGSITRIGDGNWIMAYVHVAHDCRVGSGTVMANGTTLAGHVSVGDHVTFGAFTVVHQFCSIGEHSFSAMGTVVQKDVPPYIMISGNFARPHGLNFEGLRRHHFDPETVRVLKSAYKTLYKQGLTVEQALERLAPPAEQCPAVATLCRFVRASTRGVVR